MYHEEVVKKRANSCSDPVGELGSMVNEVDSDKCTSSKSVYKSDVVERQACIGNSDICHKASEQSGISGYSCSKSVHNFSETDKQSCVVNRVFCHNSFDSVGSQCGSQQLLADKHSSKIVTRYFYNHNVNRKTAEGLLARCSKVRARPMVNICNKYPTRVFTRCHNHRVQTRSMQSEKPQLGRASGTPPLSADHHSAKPVVSDTLCNAIVVAPKNNRFIKSGVDIQNNSPNIKNELGVVPENVTSPVANNVTTTCTKVAYKELTGQNSVQKGDYNIGENSDCTLVTQDDGVSINDAARQDYCLLFYINNETSDLLNLLKAKDNWKKNVAYFQRTCSDFNKWQSQTDFAFGFVPLNDMITNSQGHIGPAITDPIQQHFFAKSFNIPNFLGARIPVGTQLNVAEWKCVFKDYWDQQLLQLIEFGFPLDFNRNSKLRSDGKNHSSALEYPEDIRAYLTEEKQHNVVIGTFKHSPIHDIHVSPFMSRDKPNAPNRRVIIDLSWPKGYSVNASVDKNSYLGSEFVLTFPTVDESTKELTRL